MKKRGILLTILIISLLTVLIILVSCSQPKRLKQNEFIALGTNISISIKNDSKFEELQNKIKEKVLYYENLFSTNISTSDISKINNATINKPIKVDKEVYFLIDESVKFNKETNNAFSIFIFELVKLWKFDPNNIPIKPTYPPSSEMINKALIKSDPNSLKLDENRLEITKTKDVMIDLGAVAKGYIADKIKELAISLNIENIIINIGGNIQLLGRDYKVGIQNPRTNEDNRHDVFSILTIKNKSIVTSGDYEKYYFDPDTNERYFHIINPRNGKIAKDSKIISASVIGDLSYICDMLATSIIVNGYEKTKPLLKKYNCEVIVVYENSKKLTYKLDSSEYKIKIVDERFKKE